MKQFYFINQIDWFIKTTNSKIDKLLAFDDKEKCNITDINFKHSLDRLTGQLESLKEIDINNPIEIQIMNKMEIHNKVLDSLEINVLDDYDVNYPLFSYSNGASTILMILLTISDNPQSCCPINKDTLLKKTLSELEDKLQKSISTKDKKTLSEIKVELKIIKELYQKNLKNLNG